MRNAKIIGTGISVPDKILTNDDLSQMLGEDIREFVTKNLGILERRVLADDESTADIASKAAENALQNAGISAEEIDLIILSTDTPEYLSPATSVVVQHRIGAKHAGTFDTNCACAGFVTALDTACKYIIADKQYKKVLVIGVYAMTKFLDWTEKETATIFADGAGAARFSKRRKKIRLLSSSSKPHGSYHDFLGIFAGGANIRLTRLNSKTVIEQKCVLPQNFHPKINIMVAKIVGGSFSRAELSLEDIKLFLWKQVNISTIKS